MSESCASVAFHGLFLATDLESRYLSVPTVRIVIAARIPSEGYPAGITVPPEHREFARQTEASLTVDPMPTFRALSRNTGIPVETLVHHALVRWVSAGSEALMAIEPPVLRELIDARGRQDWVTVGGIIDWLEAGLHSTP
ncbi:MAG: DUF6027 family protein [Solirubrobacteraceae bacterium]